MMKIKMIRRMKTKLMMEKDNLEMMIFHFLVDHETSMMTSEMRIDLKMGIVMVIHSNSYREVGRGRRLFLLNRT